MQYCAFAPRWALDGKEEEQLVCIGKEYAAESLGMFVLTFFGCGSAAVAGAALGNLGITFAFGLSIFAMAFAIGNVSGCHINPAVTFGQFSIGRISLKDLFGYWTGQFAGAIVAALNQVWVFIFAPLMGAALAAVIFRAFKSFYGTQE